MCSSFVLYTVFFMYGMFSHAQIAAPGFHFNIKIWRNEGGLRFLHSTVLTQSSMIHTLVHNLVIHREAVLAIFKDATSITLWVSSLVMYCVVLSSLIIEEENEQMDWAVVSAAPCFKCANIKQIHLCLCVCVVFFTVH